MSYVSAAGGTTSEFSSTPTATSASTANANGAVSIVASQTSASSPTGLVSVARLTFKALVAGSTTMDLDATSLSSAYQGAGGGPAAIPDTPGSLSFTAGTAPGSVSYIQPANGATDLESPVILEWSAAIGATSFKVYFGTSSNPPQVGETTSTSYQASVQPGTTYYWKIGAANDWGQTDGSTRSFSTKAPACTTPQAPVLTLASDAECSTEYVMSWAGVPNATSYQVQESLSSDFLVASTENTTETSRAFRHAVCEVTRYHYRVRAMSQNGLCNVASGWSTTQSVQVHPAGLEIEPPPAKKRPVRRPGSGSTGVESSSPPMIAVVPFVGSATGDGNSRFRTSAQLYNPGNTPIRGRMIFHPAGHIGSAADPSMIYTLLPKQTMTIPDVVMAVQGSGLGSLDVTAEHGGLPLAAFRVYSELGPSPGGWITEDLMAPADASQTGEEGVLFSAADRPIARLDLGIRTLFDGAVVKMTVYDSDGTLVGSVTKSFPANYFVQQPAIDLLGIDPPGGGTIRFQVNAGSAFVYAAVIDGLTQVPSLQLARRVPR